MIYTRELLTWYEGEIDDLLNEGRATHIPAINGYVVKREDGTSVTVRAGQILPEYDPDAAYERFLEDGGTHGWIAQAEEEEYERRNGLISFEDAYDAADPRHAADRPRRHAERAAYERAIYENGKTSEGLDTPEWQARMDAWVAEELAR